MFLYARKIPYILQNGERERERETHTHTHTHTHRANLGYTCIHYTIPHGISITIISIAIINKENGAY